MNHTMTILEINEINIIFYKKCAKKEILKKNKWNEKLFSRTFFMPFFLFLSSNSFLEQKKKKNI